MPINKVVGGFDEAVADVFDGATILIGGLGVPWGSPSYLTRALAKTGVKNLTVICNGLVGRAAVEAFARSVKVPEWFEDPGILVENKQVKKAIVSVPGMHVGGMARVSFPLEKALKEGQDIEVELITQGTLAERCRAARAGIPAYYQRTGVGTFVQRGKEVRVFDGKEYILEHAIKADFALIWGYKADPYGNLIYRGTVRCMNPTMAGAATVTIAEVEEVVNLGDLDIEVIVTPGVYVDRVVERPHGEA